MGEDTTANTLYSGDYCFYQSSSYVQREKVKFKIEIYNSGGVLEYTWFSSEYYT